MSRKKSEKTRLHILDTTWKLLNSDNGSQTRMADVAKEAGLSRQSVYLYFPSRAELLIETTRYIDEVENVADKLASVFAEKSGLDQLRAFITVWGSYIPVVYGGAKTLLALKETDDDAAAAWQDRMTGLYGVCGRIIKKLKSEGKLSSELRVKEATDLLWAGVSIRQWELLTIERKMSQKRYLQLTHRTMMRALL